MSSPTRKKPKPRQKQLGYISKAGHLAVMAEFALRGYNVAIPEIDKGDDVFVVDDRNRRLWRLQVKTATEQRHEGSGIYQVVVHEKQMITPPADGCEDYWFVFAIRRDAFWQFIVISRAQLHTYAIENGSLHGGRRTFSVTFNTQGQLNGIWRIHLDDWSAWPRINHDVPLTQTSSPPASPPAAPTSAHSSHKPAARDPLLS